MAWGGSFVATKVALRYVSPVTVVWVRFAIGTLILGSAVLIRKQFSIPSRKELAYFALLGFVGITFHQWLQSTGLQTAQATTTSWILTTVPVFIAGLGWIFLKEKMGLIQLVGIGLAIMGVLLVVSRGDLASLVSGKLLTYGDILVMISAPNWAVFSILSRNGLKTRPAAQMMFYVMASGWIFTSVQFFSGAGLTQIQKLTLNGWLGVDFLGIFCTGLAYIFWYDALHFLPASQAGAFLYLEPLVTVIVAAVVLGEPLLLASLAGGLIILLGVWVVNRNWNKPLSQKVKLDQGDVVSKEPGYF